MRVKEALDLARVNELAMRDAYAEMKDLVAGGEPTLVRLFERMSTAESGHAKLFVELAEQLDEATLAKELELTAEPLRRQIKQLVDFRERIQRVAIPLDDVFWFILEMEIGEQNGFLLALLDATGSELAERIRNDIARPAERHIRPVLDVIESMAGDEALRERAASVRLTLDWFAASEG